MASIGDTCGHLQVRSKYFFTVVTQGNTLGWGYHKGERLIPLWLQSRKAQFGLTLGPPSVHRENTVWVTLPIGISCLQVASSHNCDIGPEEWCNPHTLGGPAILTSVLTCPLTFYILHTKPTCVRAAQLFYSLSPECGRTYMDQMEITS